MSAAAVWDINGSPARLCLLAASASALVIALADGLSPLYEEGTRLIPGVAHVEHALNTGVSFSFLEAHPALAAVFSVLALICLCVFALFAPMSRPKRLLLSAAWAGGACNLFSRLRFGFVRDWIRLDFVPFPVFNCADIFITAGLLLFAFSILIRKEGSRDAV